MDDGMTWHRSGLLNANIGQCVEIWEKRRHGQVLASHRVDVTVGKELNVLALKGASVADVSEYAAYLQRTAERLYAPDAPRRVVGRCPCCDESTAQAPEEFRAFDVPYHCCVRCGHVFVRSQPTAEVLNSIFRDADEYSTTYTDRDGLEVRLAQVIAPKVAWLQQVYGARRGRMPATALDVGAGGGHFLEGLGRAGMEGAGYELNRSAVRFAHEAFDIQLQDQDFLAAEIPRGRFDAITFWGLLEYTPEPLRFIAAAHRALDPKSGLLIVEVPRYQCLSTAVQREFPRTIARHLAPTTHVNCFSDASLATLLDRGGFRPVAVWYFGMDAYELLAQLALRFGLHEEMPALAELIPGLQRCMDLGRLCDDIIVACVPIAGEA